MPEFLEIRIEGVDALAERLGWAVASATLKPPMERAVARLQGELAKYPPPPPQSTYRRTGDLGRSWATSVSESSTSVQGSVGNNVPYAPYVQRDLSQPAPHQAWMNVGRGWATDVDAVNRHRADIETDFLEAISSRLL